MDIEPKARQRIEDHIAESLDAAAPRDPDVERELRSHLFEGAHRHAEAEGAQRIALAHVEAAIADLGAAADVAHELAPNARAWTPRVPLNARGWTALALAGAGVFVAFAWVAIGFLCRFTPLLGDPALDTCAPVVSPWAGFFLAATIAGAVGIWRAVRWIAIVAAVFLLLLPLLSIGSEFFFGTLVAFLLVVAAFIMPGATQRARAKRPSGWTFLPFIPIGIGVGILSDAIWSGLLGIELEGAQEFLPAMFLTALLAWGVTLLALRTRDVAFAAGSLAVVTLFAFVGFAAFFVASFSGSGCFERGPAEAHWTDPDLYDGFPAPGRHGAFTVTYSPPDIGIPFTNATLDAKYGPGAYALESVSYRIDVNAGPTTSIALVAGPAVSFRWSDELTDAEAREIVSRFLESVANMSASQRDEFASALFAVRETEGQYYTGDPATGAPLQTAFTATLALNATLRLAELWAAEGTKGTDPMSGAQLSDWSFSFSLATRRAEGVVEAKTASLSVDVGDSATFLYGDSGTKDPVAIMRAWNATYADLGLAPAPSSVTPAATSRICVD